VSDVLIYLGLVGLPIYLLYRPVLWAITGDERYTKEPMFLPLEVDEGVL
jgi:hypothetical protein